MQALYPFLNHFKHRLIYRYKQNQIYSEAGTESKGFPVLCNDSSGCITEGLVFI